MKKFGFIVKTDSYAGNFEREMCAYMTGRIGDCEVGEEYVETLIAEKFYNVESLPDDDVGCCRPVTIVVGNPYFEIDMTHDEKCNSLIIYFRDEPSEEQIEIMKKRAYYFPGLRQRNKQSWGIGNKEFKVLGFMLVESETISKIRNIE